MKRKVNSDEMLTCLGVESREFQMGVAFLAAEKRISDTAVYASANEIETRQR